jgi:hypothetical protein
MLPMAFQSAIILSASEVLDEHLRRRLVDHGAEDSHPFNSWLTDLDVGSVGIEENSQEFDSGPNRRFPIIDLDPFPFTDSILPGTVLKNCIHEGLRAKRHSKKNNRLAIQGKLG